MEKHLKYNFVKYGVMIAIIITYKYDTVIKGIFQVLLKSFFVLKLVTRTVQ